MTVDQGDQLLVHLADPLVGVEEHQNDVGAADASLRPGQRVEVQVGADALFAHKAGGIDDQKGLAVHLDPDIDAVARGSGDGAGDHPLGLGQRVDEGTLADVAPPDDRQFHDRLFPAGVVERLGGEGLLDFVHQADAAALLLGADGDHRPAEPLEFQRVLLLNGVVRLIGGQKNGDRKPAQTLGDRLVQRGDPGAGVGDKEN